MRRTRFAPAPTGFLHLGHVVNALYVWGYGGTLGARVMLRVEDHDRQRARPEYERALLDDLDWLGFQSDEYPTTMFRAGRCEGRQSDRGPVYEAAAAQLARDGRLYGCTCTRQDRAKQIATPQHGPDAYAGTCRNRAIPLGPGIAWRVRLDTSPERFTDVWQGPCEQQPAWSHGDVVIRDRHGNWTYQFAVVVDDWQQDVNLVIRGEDLLPSTGVQMALGRVLGRREPPTYAHHRLVMKSPTQKLSKSDGDSGVRDLRRAGWSAPRVLGEAAWRAGLAPPNTELETADVARLFR